MSTQKKTETSMNDQKPPLGPAVYSVAEVADRWQVHPETVRRLIRERELKPLPSLRPYRITYDEVRRYETQIYA